MSHRVQSVAHVGSFVEDHNGVSAAVAATNRNMFRNLDRQSFTLIMAHLSQSFAACKASRGAGPKLWVVGNQEAL